MRGVLHIHRKTPKTAEKRTENQNRKTEQKHRTENRTEKQNRNTGQRHSRVARVDLSRSRSRTDASNARHAWRGRTRAQTVLLSRLQTYRHPATFADSRRCVHGDPSGSVPPGPAARTACTHV